MTSAKEKQSAVSSKDWIKTVLVLGVQMFLFALTFGGEITLRKVLIYAVISLVGGLLCDYVLNLSNNRKTIQEANDTILSKDWIITGLVFGGLMFITMTLFYPLAFDEVITLRKVLIDAVSWLIGGLFYGYCINLGNDPKTTEEANYTEG